MKYIELASELVTAAVLIASAIANAFPTTRVGLICARFAATLRHDVVARGDA